MRIYKGDISFTLDGKSHLLGESLQMLTMLKKINHFLTATSLVTQDAKLVQCFYPILTRKVHANDFLCVDFYISTCVYCN